MKAILQFNSGIADDIEEAMGGGEREFIALAVLLADYAKVDLYFNTAHSWLHNGVTIHPIAEFSKALLESANLYISTSGPFPADSLGIRRCFYQWVDYAGVPDNVDLVITDTWRGKMKYMGQGHNAVVYFPCMEPYNETVERDATKILFVGALHGGKRPDLAIEAMSLLPEYTLHVIGHVGNLMDFGQKGIDADAVYSQYCKAIAGDNVFFRGELPYSEMIHEMQSATAVIIPYCSINEFNTNVALEAISNGCIPIIADGLADYISDDACIRLPDQNRLDPSIIADRFLTKADDVEAIRLNSMTIANGIATYCKGEMIDAILGSKE